MSQRLPPRPPDAPAGSLPDAPAGSLDPSPIQRRTAMWLGGIAAISLIAAVLISIFANTFTAPPVTGANTYSRSAIGHNGLVELLRALGTPVLVSEHDSAAKASPGTLLVIAEPVVIDPTGPRARSLRAMVEGSPLALVVLPKWYGTPSKSEPAWLEDAVLLDTAEIHPVLAAMDISATVVRPPTAGGWRYHDDFLDLTGVAHIQPDLPWPQLIQGDDLIPLITTEQGILLGEAIIDDDHAVLVLSDPDLLSNHGLVRGRNATLAVGIIASLRAAVQGDGAVIFDETIHGFHKEPSIWRALFEFPLALATTQALLAVALLLWAAMGRFGKPLTPPPAITPGKSFLIGNTASLLRMGQHTGQMLERYLHATIAEVARARHAPHDLDPPALRTWLARLEDTRRPTDRLAELERHTSALVQAAGAAPPARQQRAVAAAYRIYRWREEMSHGSTHPQRD